MTILTVSVGRLRYRRLEKFGISEKKDMHGFRWKNEPKADILCGGGCVNACEHFATYCSASLANQNKTGEYTSQPESAALKNFNVWGKKKYKLGDQLHGSEAKG